MKFVLAVVLVAVATVAIADGRAVARRRVARDVSPPPASTMPPSNWSTPEPPMNTTEYPDTSCPYNPCMNGGSCFQYGNYTWCSCTGSYYGEFCEYYGETSTWVPTSSPSSCSSNPCFNGGTCVPLEFMSSYMPYYCLCPFGFGGSNCSQRNDQNNTNIQPSGVNVNLFFSVLNRVSQGKNRHH